MLLQRTGACLLRALAPMFCLRVWISSIWEEIRSKRYRHAVHHLASCRRLGGAIEAWGAIPKHNSYINELFCAYGHRVGSMNQIKCLIDDTFCFLSRQGLSWGQTGGGDGDGLFSGLQLPIQFKDSPGQRVTAAWAEGRQPR